MGNILPTLLLSSLQQAPRVALVTETWPPEINGVAMTLSRLADGLRARNWQVALVRPRQQENAESPMLVTQLGIVTLVRLLHQ